uniref:Transmembrane 9 superfamily member n=1 Tax=Romanomermis culicivorax TaxID=13658 RepID=A0A915I5Y7_ROMCU
KFILLPFSTIYNVKTRENKVEHCVNFRSKHRMPTISSYANDISINQTQKYFSDQNARLDNVILSNVTLFVNRLDSDQSVIPYEYHHFDFCLGNENESPVENLGQVLFGERIRPSVYEISFLKEEPCKSLCKKTYSMNNKDDQFKLTQLAKGMMLNYYHHWYAFLNLPLIIDNMPVTFCVKQLAQHQNTCMTGFPMGCYVTQDRRPKDGCGIDPSRYNKPNTFYLFNHVDLTVEYRDMSVDWNMMEENSGGRIVAIKVEPRSIQHLGDKLDCSSDAPPLEIPESPKEGSTLDITYSYSIKFQKSNIKWSSRWDYILESIPQSNIQWFRQ